MLSGFIPLLITPVASSPTPVETFDPAAFTWQTFNKNMNVTTFVSPDGSRDALWKFLNSAEESIYVEIYGINHPYILDLIHEIHDMKPSIEMKFLIGWNSLGYPSPNKYVANNLTLLGYPVKWTNSSDFTYAHQKYLVIDNKTTIVQAGNWAKTSFPDVGYDANREWNIAMTDTDVAAYYLSVFDYDWNRGTDYNALTDGTGDPLTNPTATSTYPRPFATAGEFSGPMNVTPIFSPDTSLQGILYCINVAQATLDIQIPYFTSIGDSGAVDQVVDAILAAKARGVTVRVITEEEKDFVEIAEILVEHNIPIVWQDTRWFTALHNKGIIVDGRIVLISSINYSDGSISDNREAGVIIENDAVAQWYQNVYDYDWGLADCDELDEVNLYWDPNIPTHTAAINVTVYAQMLYGDTITDVSLGVKIGSGAWNNYTITANVYPSAEGQDENFFYVIPAQADGTNITVQASVQAGGVWHQGEEMVIRVRDSIGSAITTTTSSTITTTTISTTTTEDVNELIMQLLPYIAIAIVAAIGGICVKKRR
jgi:phosphatidylserine/phosphatidylglycerophosphate/cardiolipin synthase-like enzyme